MERYRSYASHADAVNWGVYEAPFSLEEGRGMFPDCAIMGGLPNRSGVMTDGSVEELEKEGAVLVFPMRKDTYVWHRQDAARARERILGDLADYEEKYPYR